MQVGISTASLFKRYDTIGALKSFNENGVNCAEVFLESFCEYNKKFGKKLKKVKGDVKINSIHTLTTQFEPQLFSENLVARKDSFNFLTSTLECAKEIGAKNYTFHGGVNFKKLPFKINYEKHAELTQKVIDLCKNYGVNLAYENVHWAYFNHLGFFKTLKSLTSGLKCTLDIKQAWQSRLEYKDLIEEMGEDIVTVHISSIDKNGKMCLPLSKDSTVDFEDLFKRLKDVNFNGAILIENYFNDYSDESQLYNSYYECKNLAEKIFK